MNREKKFKVWDKIEKEFREPKIGWVFNEETKEISLVIHNNSGKYEVVEYTGLKDKNGKEIYEGDICKVKVDDSESYKGVVEYRDGSFWIMKHNGYGGEGYELSYLYSRTRLNNSEVEKIGNIYENPNLINK